jgi:hypothetical protein
MCLFSVFYVCKLCIHGGGIMWAFIFLILEDELASLSMLVFVFREISWEYGSNWCVGLWKDEELLIYER